MGEVIAAAQRLSSTSSRAKQDVVCSADKAGIDSSESEAEALFKGHPGVG
jgi:hypothetical protein